MDRVGVLIVSKCLSAPGIIGAFGRSGYKPEFYVVERQVNPFSFGRAKVHHVVPDLNVAEVARFARRYKTRLSFGLTDTEDFIVAGGRDAVERESGVPMLCVTGRYAVEKSKADQRTLFESLFKDANPRYTIYDPSRYGNDATATADFRRFASELKEPVIKPDAPARGAGVGVWGQEFSTEEEMLSFFKTVYSKGRVVVEEKLEGEESSFHALSDGRHFICRAPDEGLQTRPRREQGAAHRRNGELPRGCCPSPIPEGFRVGVGGEARARGLPEVEGEGVQPRAARLRPL